MAKKKQKKDGQRSLVARCWSSPSKSLCRPGHWPVARGGGPVALVLFRMDQWSFRQLKAAFLSRTYGLWTTHTVHTIRPYARAVVNGCSCRRVWTIVSVSDLENSSGLWLCLQLQRRRQSVDYSLCLRPWKFIRSIQDALYASQP
jgi:hypothetical protein